MLIRFPEVWDHEGQALDIVAEDAVLSRKEQVLRLQRRVRLLELRQQAQVAEDLVLRHNVVGALATEKHGRVLVEALLAGECARKGYLNGAALLPFLRRCAAGAPKEHAADEGEIPVQEGCEGRAERKQVD